MDSAQRQLKYDEPKLLPFDGRARMRRFSRDVVEMSPERADSVMLFSAVGDYMGTFESPSHAEIHCAALGIELAPGIEKITWDSLKSELYRLAYSPNFIFQAAP